VNINAIGVNSSYAAALEEQNVRFRWAFGAVTGSGSEQKFVAIDRDMALNTGDQLKMLVEPQSKCFVYVIHHGPEDQVRLLFPYTLEQFSSDYLIGIKYYIPAGDAWFELDKHAGKETFYLLAAPERLQGLEELLRRYAAANVEKKPELAAEVLAEIRTVKKQHRDLTAAAERPVVIGGRIRGLERPQSGDNPDVATISDEVLSTRFYGRTFTIDHQ
jgi:hypothetical protein